MAKSLGQATFVVTAGLAAPQLISELMSFGLIAIKIQARGGPEGLPLRIQAVELAPAGPSLLP